MYLSIYLSIYILTQNACVLALSNGALPFYSVSARDSWWPIRHI